MIPTADQDVTVIIAPTVQATGRILDSKGRPLPDLVLHIGLRVRLRDGTLISHFVNQITTAKDGTFALPGLVRGCKYDLCDNKYNAITSFEVKEDDKLIVLGDKTPVPTTQSGEQP